MNFMRIFKLSIFFLSLILSISSYTKVSVSIPSDDSVPKVRVTGGELSILVEKSGSSPANETDPHKIYMPFNDGTSENFYFSKTAVTLPTASTGTIEFDLRLENDTGNDAYIFVAAKRTDGSFDIVANKELNVSQTDGDDFTYSVTMAELCAGEGVNCGISDSEDQTVLFIGLSESNPGSGTLSGLSGYTGVYYNFYLSSSYGNGEEIEFTELRRGDGRLTAVYEGHNMSNFDKAYAVIRSSPSSTAQMISAFRSEIISIEEIGEQFEGTADIKDLDNGSSYLISIVLVDKFNFASLASVTRVGSPSNIEAFLVKQSCYLISAGFQQEHFILDYFRWIRDEVLLSFGIGKSFVDFYYNTAPFYAKFIYQSAGLSFVVKALSYFLFFLINACLLVILLYPIIYIAKRNRFTKKTGVQ